MYEWLQPRDTVNYVWINHYAKGAWLRAAAVQALSGQLEQGKAFGPLLMVAAALLVFAAAAAAVGRWRAGILAALAALNPVSVCQILTFYVDGQVWLAPHEPRRFSARPRSGAEMLPPHSRADGALLVAAPPACGIVRKASNSEGSRIGARCGYGL